MGASTSAVVLALALATILGCPRDGGLVAPPPAAEAEPPGAPARDPGPPFATDRAGYVGMLIENALHSTTAPSAYCLEDGALYEGADARVGDLNVFIDRDLSALAGRPVLVRGTREPSLLAAVKKRGPCPPKSPAEHAQVRSDWVSPEGGFRTTRDRLRNRPYLRATDVIPIDLGALIDVSAERVIVELRNPFDRPMDGLRAVAHYEGGPGKPMPRYEPITLSLPPGGTQRLELAARVEAGPAGKDDGGPRGTYALSSVDIEGALGAVEVKVTIPARVSRIRKR